MHGGRLILDSASAGWHAITLRPTYCAPPATALNSLSFSLTTSRHGAAAQVVCHMMPDLPNVRLERDLEAFREFFESPDFRADGLKLYPTLVIRGGWRKRKGAR